MAVLDFDNNALFGENGTGKLYIATDYDGQTYADGDGTNETTSITDLETNTFSDVGYFENFATVIRNGEERVITTDYCGVGEIRRKAEKIPGFSVDVQEILNMENLALILGTELNASASAEIIGMKRQFKDKPYQLFKFVTCPKNGNSNTFYFVKSVLTGDISMPMNNLSREDFVGVTLEFETADGGNFFLKKEL